MEMGQHLMHDNIGSITRTCLLDQTRVPLQLYSILRVAHQREFSPSDTSLDLLSFEISDAASLNYQTIFRC